MDFLSNILGPPGPQFHRLSPLNVSHLSGVLGKIDPYCNLVGMLTPPIHTERAIL